MREVLFGVVMGFFGAVMCVSWSYAEESVEGFTSAFDAFEAKENAMGAARDVGAQATGSVVMEAGQSMSFGGPKAVGPGFGGLPQTHLNHGYLISKNIPELKKWNNT